MIPETAENEGAAVAGDIVTDFLARIGVEAQKLIDELLEVGIVSSGGTREPTSAEHLIQFIEGYGTCEDFGHVQWRPNGVHQNL